MSRVVRYDEEYYAEHFHKCSDVSEDECYMGGHNCGTCRWCTDRNKLGTPFSEDYCRASEK